MPDYTSILRRSIAALPDPSPEMRAVVYQRARAALARQLTAVDPPLSTREIETQHQDLEDAVVRLEADYAPEDSAEPDEAGASGEDDAFRSMSRTEAIHEPVAPAEGAQAEHAPPDYDGEIDEDEDEDEEFDDEERPSRLPLIVGGLVVLLVIIGVGAYLYAERDRIARFLDFSAEEQVAVVPPPAPVNVVPAPAPDPAAPEPLEADPNKLPDRLTNGPDTAPAEAPPVDAATAEPEVPLQLPGGEEQPLETPPVDMPPETTAETPPEMPPETPAEPPPPDMPAVLPPEQQTAALEQPGQSIVAQRAIFYFKGTEGTPARQVDGTATWAQISRESGPAIQATLRFADQDATTTVTIYRNDDTSLPASHLVEVQFSGDLGASPVQRVPALVLKPTEQARGEPLTGAAVPVTSELFWLALSNEQERVTRNIQLLREGSWFDLPILFDDGAQGLLTFEKGIPGDRVFETVMSTWVPG